VPRANANSWLLPSGLVLGSLGALAFTSIPSPWLLCVAACAGMLGLWFAPLRYLATLVLACIWTLWNFQLRLDDRLQPELSGRVTPVSGIISSIPQQYDDYVSFRFEPRQEALADPPEAGLPRILLVRWYEQWPTLKAGQAWRLELLLKPPWGPVNFQGSDREKWLFASGIGAVASVRAGRLEAEAGTRGKWLAALRESVLRHIRTSLVDKRSAGIVQALAVADRSGLSRSDRQLLALTGTSHLLAISGLHIGLAAAAGMLLTRWFGWLLPLASMGSGFYLLSLGGGAVAAAAYAALAGFGVPTVRSLVMLLVVTAAISMSRSIHPARAWLLALAAVLLIDPFAALGAGFWFSFMAVAALLWVFVPRPGRRSWWRSLLMAQAAVMLVLLPVSAMWFQAFSLVGFAANLVAIPMVSFGLVPFVLAGVAALWVSAPLSTLAWTVAGGIAGVLLDFLEIMAALQGEMILLVAPSLAGALLALLGAFLLLLPRGFPGRWLGAVLLAPLFLPAAPRSAATAMDIEILDVGQGTAVLLRADGRSLLYDSGPGDGAGRDRVSSVIVPAINRAGGRPPDRVIISHGDQDHAGGLWSLRARFPASQFNANLARPQPGVDACHTPVRWTWGATAFRVLHPSRALPYLGNDSSCVIAVERRSGQVLLSGDISAAIEARLLLGNISPARLLLVPHHGSRSSSSPAFLEGVGPEVAVATASLGNRFGFPKPEIRLRYETAGIRFWSTGECGALRIVIHDDGRLAADSARLSRPAIWRWPAAKGCPEHFLSR
jgi:competence protein ComEC